MKSTQRAGLWIMALLISLLPLAGCSVSAGEDQQKSAKSTGKQVNAVQEEALTVGAWIPDWLKTAGTKEVTTLGETLDRAYLFAAYFNRYDRLYVGEEFKKQQKALAALQKKDRSLAIWGTVVNDRYIEEGKSFQKESELVSRLLVNSTKTTRHVSELIKFAVEYGFAGLEVDYERVAAADMDQYRAFITELYDRLQEKGIDLRVVVEPGRIAQDTPWPEGPEYVVMAYNLYGTHTTEPGPKASFQWIRELIKKMAELPGTPGIAFAMGGFDWEASGVTALDETAAQKLSRGKQVKRDVTSNALYYTYQDKNRGDHTVWYADAETLIAWMEVAREAGVHDITLWRLGSSTPQTLRELRTYIQEATAAATTDAAADAASTAPRGKDAMPKK
jgi:spore germination protein YaaH